MKAKVRITEYGQPMPADRFNVVLKRITDELNKRLKEGTPTRTGMRVAIKLGLLAYESNIIVGDFCRYAGIDLFEVDLPEKHTTLEIAIFFE